MGKARAFRKGLFNRSYGAFFFWKELSFVDFHISAFESTFKATTFSVYYFIHHGNKHPIMVVFKTFAFKEDHTLSEFPSEIGEII